MLPNKSLQGKGLCTYKDTACSAYGGTTALLASVHQVHGVGLAVLLVSVLGFVEHGGLLIFEHTLQNALDSV